MYARPDKESHLDTVWYEIEMLDYCRQRIVQYWEKWKQPHRNVYLEDFLLHYRSLLEVFGCNHYRQGDLIISNARDWTGRDLEASELASMRDPAYALDGKYYDEISKYLQHCTERRVEKKDWKAEEMYHELGNVLSKFKQLFPRQAVPPPTSTADVSTATIIGPTKIFDT